MILPPILSIKDFITSDNIKEYDKVALITKAYEIFTRDFIDEGVFYEGQQVKIRDKLLDCSICDYNCSNIFCTCEFCPWNNTKDIFQHITSDYDLSLESKLTKKAKKMVSKRRNSNPNYKVRTPGIFSKSRTIRIPWIKAIIENANDSDIKKKIVTTRKNEFKIKLYYPKEDYLVILVGMIFADGSRELYLNSAYYNPYPSLLRDLI